MTIRFSVLTLPGQLCFDGIGLVSYDRVGAAEDQRPGDRVQICVVSRPMDCHPGDRRGSLFRVHDPGRGTSFMIVDAQHGCGGA